MRWEIILTGEAFDLQELAKSLDYPELTITHEGDHFLLKATIFNEITDVNDLRAKAKELLVLLTGASRLALGTRKPIEICSIGLIRSDGVIDKFILVEDQVAVTELIGISVVHDDGVTEQYNQADPIIEWIRIASSNENVAKALRLLATKHATWTDLYRTLEVIQKDVGGLGFIVQQEWATKNLLRRFKHTADSVSAIGDEARHGKEATEPPKDPMTFSEAKSLIETLLHNWLRFRKDKS